MRNCADLIRSTPSKIPSAAKTTPFEEECERLFSSFLNVLGVPKSVGAIYGLLFASPEPLCFAQILAKLDVSKGSVSQGLSFLKQSGAVKVVKLSGDRRDFFEPELALRRLASGLLQEKVRPLSLEAREAVNRLRRATKVGDPEHKFRSERIAQMETWNKQLSRVLPVVQAVLSVSSK